MSTAEITQFKKIRSIVALAEFFEVSEKQLRFNLYARARPTYRHFALRKAAGGTRNIFAPPEKVLHIQQKVLRCVSGMVVPKEGCHGFSKDRSIVTNAREHLNSQWLLNIDLRDFFPSIHFGRIRGLFANRPFWFPDPVATLLAQACCHQGVLPQGAPTSPILSNLVCRGLDRDLQRLAKRNSCRYSRYADDITFSAQQGEPPEALVGSWVSGGSRGLELGRELLALISHHMFTINGTKSRLAFRNERQEVTGLIVGSRVNVPRSYVRSIRASICDVRRNGKSIAQTRFEKQFDNVNRLGPSPSIVRNIEGRLAFMSMVRGKDDPLTAKLRLQAQQVLGSYPHGVEVFGRAVPHELMESCVWAIFMVGPSGTDVSNGTAFYLKEVGFVTSNHVFDSVTKAGFSVQRWEIAPANNLGNRKPITHARRFSHGDLATFKCGQNPLGALKASVSSPSVGDRIRAFGFPEIKPGDHLYSSNGVVTQLSAISGLRYLSSNAGVSAGASGGPLISDDGLVIAVIAGDTSHSLWASGGPLITELSHLASVPLTTL